MTAIDSIVLAMANANIGDQNGQPKNKIAYELLKHYYGNYKDEYANIFLIFPGRPHVVVYLYAFRNPEVELDGKPIESEFFLSTSLAFIKTTQTKDWMVTRTAAHSLWLKHDRLLADYLQKNNIDIDEEIASLTGRNYNETENNFSTHMFKAMK